MPDSFFIKALLAGLGVALVAAPLGCFIVWRRMAYFGATIAHSGLLGVAVGLFLAIDLMVGVIAVALALSALLYILQKQRVLPQDTLLGILAHVALAAGLIVAASLGGNRFDLMAYLFGDILSVGTRDLVWIYGGGAVVLGITMWIWRPLLALSVNEELAAAEGVDVARTSAAFMLLLAFTVALAMKLVGILLIASLLVIPAAAARPFAVTPERMAVIAAGVAVLSVVAGLGASLWLDTPAGPSIVMVMAAIFALGFAAAVRPQGG
ncbi:MAG: metal ABC transporter permease [Hyphomicrobiales bacterium]|nr:metal ABC transporter permease [Hyphomicrobiales bacterium]